MDKDELYERIMQESLSQNNGCGQPMLAAIIIAIILLFSSCASKRQIEYVDREIVKYQKELVHDTLIQHTHDSVYHTIFQKGDTIYDTKYVEKTRWRDRIVVKTDTCFRDSVVTDYKETVKEVVKYPKTYWFAVGISVLFFIIAIIKFVRWFKMF
jgi:hypothetical protein